MPELPEVEACRRLLAAWGKERRLAGVQLGDGAAVRATPTTHPVASEEAAQRLQGWVGGRLGTPLRRGKRIAWPLGDGGLLLHLGMTGHWVRRASLDPPRFGRVGLTLDDGSTLWLVDARRFGCLVPLGAEELDAALRTGLGPDPLVDGVDGPALTTAMAGSRAPLKVALMDQARVAGLGNIQAVEALHEARLHPARPAGSLSSVEADHLAHAIGAVLARTLSTLGAGEVAYLSDGAENPFAVYGRGGEPCRTCGTAIAQHRHAGRVTTWCPSCQLRRPEG